MENTEEKFYKMGVASKELINNSEEQFKKCTKNLKNKIESYPFICTGIAIIAGILLTKLFSSNKN